ncbi:hypothetical protein A2U01_0040582, partial [Trifolium medium]|nr:hypothetical protein [Trifolium medium]
MMEKNYSLHFKDMRCTILPVSQEATWLRNHSPTKRYLVRDLAQERCTILDPSGSKLMTVEIR